jgi:hypothetical protein
LRIRRASALSAVASNNRIAFAHGFSAASLNVLKRFQKTFSHRLGRIREDEPKKVVPADTGAKSSSSIFFYPWL